MYLRQCQNNDSHKETNHVWDVRTGKTAERPDTNDYIRACLCPYHGGGFLAAKTSQVANSRFRAVAKQMRTDVGEHVTGELFLVVASQEKYKVTNQLTDKGLFEGLHYSQRPMAEFLVFERISR